MLQSYNNKVGDICNTTSQYWRPIYNILNSHSQYLEYSIMEINLRD